MQSSTSSGGNQRLLLGTFFVFLIALGAAFASAFTSAAPSPANLCSSCSAAAGLPVSPALQAEFNIAVLTAGANYSFAVRRNRGLEIGKGEQWLADFGHIDNTGYYTAPAYMPPHGLDFITYIDRRGTRVTVSIRIEPNADISGSGELRWLELLHTTPDDMGKPNPYLDPSLYQPNNPLFGLTVNEAMPIARPLQMPPGPFPVANETEIPLEQIDRDFGYLMPAFLEGTGSPTEAIYVRDDPPQTQAYQLARKKPKKAKIGPLFPDRRPADPCAGTTPYVVPGPWTISCVPGNWIDMGNQHYWITDKMSASIWKFFHVDVAGGAEWTGRIWSKEYRYRAIQYQDVWVCVNGHWVDYPKRCYSFASGFQTFPTFWGWINGGPANGGPITWTPVICNDWP